MVHVNFKERMGYYYAPATNGKKRKVWICEANCLWAEINFYKNENKEVVAQLCGFLGDLEHLKRCLKNGIHLNYQGLTFFAEKMKVDLDLWKAVKVLVENGIKVTIK